MAMKLEPSESTDLELLRKVIRASDEANDESRRQIGERARRHFLLVLCTGSSLWGRCNHGTILKRKSKRTFEPTNGVPIRLFFTSLRDSSPSQACAANTSISIQPEPSFAMATIRPADVVGGNETGVQGR